MSRVAMVALTLSLFLAPSARAQEIQRAGWFLGGNVGGGSAGFKLEGASSDREIGGGFGAYVAYSPKPLWAVGLDLRGWASSVGGVDWVFGGVGPVISIYPGEKGFFLRGGFGIGSIEASSSLGDASDTGFAGMASVGYELSIVRTVTLSPQADYLYIAVGEGVSADVVNVSLGLNWYGWAEPHRISAP